MIGPGAVIQTLVALLAYGTHSTAVNFTGGMVVDPCLCARRPDKNLQREGVVLALRNYEPRTGLLLRLSPPQGGELSQPRIRWGSSQDELGRVRRTLGLVP